MITLQNFTMIVPTSEVKRKTTRSFAAGNGLATAAVTCLLLLNCSTQPTTTSSTASRPTLHTSSSPTFLTRLILHSVFALDLTT